MTSLQQTAPNTLRVVAADSMRFGIIALIAFLTLVDLFAAQAILPSLVAKFAVSRATMGFAVNASTFGMAIAGIVVALFGRNIDRRNGIWISLAVLAVPTTLLVDDRQHHDLRPAARRAGPMHVDRVHADRCLSRRAFLAGPGDRRTGRLCHRQCRQQFLRPHHVGGRRRYVRPLDQLPDLCRAQHRRRGARLGDAQEDRAHDGDGRLDA